MSLQYYSCINFNSLFQKEDSRPNFGYILPAFLAVVLRIDMMFKDAGSFLILTKYYPYSTMDFF
ncbi:hypothetical protein NTE_00347 [Candidatus Nitrososphaera evergladensis SR1]|uniref:Uncharacterized protein n=1 Tax=Candidatus Nitrososphaera evergladensis SR1 TaxID=1459636 RepID=A0A075MSU9_9ARCH|nr:hypothetical protein NTE_00347 [Candidatus Nitrososphaera evergladensis SR1]